MTPPRQLVRARDFDDDPPTPPFLLAPRQPSPGPAGPARGAGGRLARPAGPARARPMARPVGGGPGGPAPGISALSPEVSGRLQNIRQSISAAERLLRGTSMDIERAKDEMTELSRIAETNVEMPQAPTGPIAVRRASSSGGSRGSSRGSAAAAFQAADAAARGDDYNYDMKDAPPFRPPRRRTTARPVYGPERPPAPFGPQRPERPRRPQGQRIIERKQYSNVEDCSRDLLMCEQRLPNGKIPKVLQNLEIPQGHDLQSTNTFFYWKANGTGRQYWSQHQLERYLCGGYEPMLANNEVRRELERRRDLYLQQYASCKRGNKM